MMRISMFRRGSSRYSRRITERDPQCGGGAIGCLDPLRFRGGKVGLRPCALIRWEGVGERLIAGTEDAAFDPAAMA